jgi:hypothetical protein
MPGLVAMSAGPSFSLERSRLRCDLLLRSWITALHPGVLDRGACSGLGHAFVDLFFSVLILVLLEQSLGIERKSLELHKDFWHFRAADALDLVQHRRSQALAIESTQRVLVDLLHGVVEIFEMGGEVDDGFGALAQFLKLVTTLNCVIGTVKRIR